MDRSIPVGTLAGVRIGMSWVVPLVAFLYATTLAGSLLPRAVPYQESSTYWLVGGVGAALFFGSLLAHEMGHALVGRREGIGVRGITLTLLGGYTQFVTEPETPGAELRVSGIGPATNFVLAGVFQAASLALAGSVDGVVAVTGEMLGWLAWVNLLLAMVNMLPGAPLDGGAVLESLIWMATRDRNAAARSTAWIGVALGVAITAVGVFLFVDGSSPFAIWAIIGGVIVLTSAQSRLRSASSLGRLRSTRMAEVMLADPPVVPEWSSLSDVVARAPGWQPHTAFPVQAVDGRITGLLTAELVMAVDPRDWPMVRAVDVAWPIDRVPTASVDDALLPSLQRADSAGIDRILVVWPDGRVAGTSGRDAVAQADATTG